MRIFVIADVHANAAALDAVLARIPDESPDLVLCLGDVVGYNAEPRETLAAIRAHCDVVIEGNHDCEGATPDATHPTTGRSARLAIDYTREQLDDRDKAYLAQLPPIHCQPEFVAVHGCYLNDRHITGYVTSTMLERNLARVGDNEEWSKLAFCGHTHVPMLGYVHNGTVQELETKREIGWPAKVSAVLVNPGSVGQPRDQNPDAAYCVVDVNRRSARFERVPYDLERTIAANLRAQLPEDLSHRLREGR